MDKMGKTCGKDKKRELSL